MPKTNKSSAYTEMSVSRNISKSAVFSMLHISLTLFVCPTDNFLHYIYFRVCPLLLSDLSKSYLLKTFSSLSGNHIPCLLSSLLNSNFSQNPPLVSTLWPQLKHTSSLGMILTLEPFLEKLFLHSTFHKPFGSMNHYFIP